MARINSEEARFILCDMVSKKAEVKRDKLRKDLRAVDDEIKTSYIKRSEAAHRDIDAVLPAVFKSEISRILAKYKLSGMEVAYNNISGECRYRFVDDEGYKRRVAKEKELSDLDKRIENARQDIRLRVALGIKYDEAVAIINNLQF